MFAVNRRLGVDFRVLWCGDFLEEDYYGYSFALFKPITLPIPILHQFWLSQTGTLIFTYRVIHSKRKVSWFCAPDVPLHFAFFLGVIFKFSHLAIDHPQKKTERVAVGGWICCKNLLKTLVFTVICSNKGSKTVILDQKSFHHDATRL